MDRPTLSAIVVALVLLLTANLLLNTPSPSYSDPFEEWKQTYSQQWPTQQEPYRRMVFLRELAEVRRHNANASRTYDKGINQFSAMTQEEFNVYVGMSFSASQSRQSPVVDAEFRPNGAIDWVQRGMVSPVKDQGACGAYGAFAAVSMAESWVLQKHIGQKDLSEQQLIDCSTRNDGCNWGSLMAEGCSYIRWQGIVTESEYPYVAKKQQCQQSGGPLTISNLREGPGNSCFKLYDYLDQTVVGVYLGSAGWKSYKSGIFSECGQGYSYQAVLVGATKDYWKIKNSWGTSWGEQGYIRLASGNTCDICGIGPNYFSPNDH